MKNKYLVYYICIFYFILQFLILLQLKKNEPTFYLLQKVTDSVGFYNTANLIVNKNILGHNGTYNQSPLYYYLLSGIIFIFSNDLFLIRIIQIVLSSLNIFIIYHISLLTFNNKKYALVTAVVFSLTGIGIFYNILILREFLVILFNNLFIYFFLLLITKKKAKFAFLSGITAAFAILCRPNFLILIPFIIILQFFYNIKHLLIMIISFLIIFSILIIRNYLTESPLLKISSKGRYEFAYGNLPESTGIGWSEISLAYKLSKENKSFVGLIYKILKINKNNYFNFIKLQLNKTAAFINNYEIPNNYNYYFYRNNFAKLFNIAFINSGFIILTGIVGIFLLYNKSNVSYLISLGYIVLYSFTVIGFYVISRFRIPVIMFLTIFSGAGIVKSYELIKYKKNKKLLITVLLIIVLIYPVYFYKFKGINKNYDTALSYANIGSHYLDKKNYDASLKYYFKAIKYSSPAQALTTIAKIYKSKKDIQQAIQWYHKTLEYYPFNTTALYFLSEHYFNQKDYKSSLPFYLKLFLIKKFKGHSSFRLGIIYFFEKELDKAEYYWKEALKYTQNHKMIKHNLKQIKKMRKNSNRPVKVN